MWVHFACGSKMDLRGQEVGLWWTASKIAPLIPTFWYPYCYTVYSYIASGLFCDTNRPRTDGMRLSLKRHCGSVLLFLLCHLLWGASCHVIRTRKQSYGEAYLARNWGLLQQTSEWAQSSLQMNAAPVSGLSAASWEILSKNHWAMPLLIPDPQTLWENEHFLF